MRITPQTRAMQDQLRILALRTSLLYERRLIRLRTNELKRVLKLGEKLPLSEWSNQLPFMLDEDYLNKYYENLYLAVGRPISKEAVNRFMVKKSDMWDDIITGWVQKNAGKKITLINETFKDYMKSTLERIMEPTAGIELTTQNVYREVLKDWSGVREWQVRRIVQTEAMTASSVASYESVKVLGIPFEKTWVNSGMSNTRDTHAEADGQTVPEDEPFIVGGEMMMYPHDDSMGASAGNIINCACSHIARPLNISNDFI